MYRIEIFHDSILNRQVDVIVNSAHPSLLHGSGISGVIHKAAGKELEQYCKGLGVQDFGSAVISPGFNLSQKHVIHVITPKSNPMSEGNTLEEMSLLARCYREILRVAESEHLHSIAIPPLGIGRNGFDQEDGLSLAITTLESLLPELKYVQRVELVSNNIEHVTFWNNKLKDCI